MSGPTGTDPNAKIWIVRIERRRDGKMYFFDHEGNCNARRSSSMRLTKDVAQQLSSAIASQHRDFTARAMRFDSKVFAVKSAPVSESIAKTIAESKAPINSKIKSY